jgi:hypothetical protein
MSGRKNVILPIYIIGTTANGALVSGSMAADITGPATDVQYLDNIGIQIKWTSSDAIGSIEIQGSNNYNPRLLTGDFEALTFSPVLDQPASNNGGYLVDLNQFPFKYIRVFYDRTSGTGTLEAWLTAKML